MTLRWRITSTLAAVALLVSTLAVLSAYFATESQLRTGIDDTLKSGAAVVNASADPRGGRGPGGRPGPLDSAECPAAASFQPASAAQLVGADGAVVGCITGGPRLPVTTADRQVSSGHVLLRTISLGGQRYRLLSTPWHEGGTLQIARSLAESDGVLDRLRLRLLILVVVATALPALIGWAVATRLTRPIMRLRDTTEHIATTLDLSEPVVVAGSGEVGSLARSFGTMVTALARSRQQQQRLVSDASHELRTPLTSLRSNTELLRRIERLPEAERHEVVDDVLEDIDELTAVVAELVDLASDTAAVESVEPVRLAELARTVAVRAGRRHQRPVTVVDRAPRDVWGRPRQLERAISNLVDNAIKYSPSTTAVEILVDGAGVCVLDRGPGVAEAERERIFDRFYRSVRDRGRPGSGLGLAIVADIVGRHGGQVFAAARDGGGAAVGFRLPG